jgi:hypothetical protein
MTIQELLVRDGKWPTVDGPNAGHPEPRHDPLRDAVRIEEIATRLASATNRSADSIRNSLYAALAR